MSNPLFPSNNLYPGDNLYPLYEDLSMDYSLSPVHGINKYLWEMLKDNNLMDPADYDIYIPIIPTDQVRELNNIVKDGVGVPFIVYTFRTNPISQAWYTQEDNIVYIIYSQDQSDLIKINNMMVDIFKRWDESGQNVQDFIELIDHPILKQYNIKTVSIDSAGGPEPQTQENGRMAAVISIRVTYTVD